MKNINIFFSLSQKNIWDVSKVNLVLLFFFSFYFVFKKKVQGKIK